MTDNTPLYNLKAVIHETGLGPETLRAWERRYGLIKPQRSPGGHRLYSQHDIDMLNWLVTKQKEGLSISRAVELWRSLNTAGQDPLQQMQPPQQTRTAGGGTLDEIREQWIAACLAYDEQAAERLLSQAFAIATPETASIEVTTKGLAEIGSRWRQGTASVQQEHFASALAMRRIQALIAASPPPARAERILAACPPSEEHEYTLLLASFLLRRRGWEMIYLGANVPLSQLDATIQVNSPTLVLSVAQTLPGAAALREMADYVSSQKVALAYGGGIFNRCPALTERIRGHYLGGEIAAIPVVIGGLLSRRPSLPSPQPISPEYEQAMVKFIAAEALIQADVNLAMQTESVEPALLANANAHFSQNIRAALSLGDITFLDESVGWLSGLLDYHETSVTVSAHFYHAYRQGVQRYLDRQGALILSWFEKVPQPM